ncbi:hypothetical protein BA896_018875 [Janthinobacterium lividum]|uniref:Uncharacterized protein n=1 Tax=Janthinobacterium lividum TaxID=29581 RepID=A0A1E8PL53_9BURK|nr:hypothetical protein BA896_018875 [Janthinobacterium lividum]
MLKYSRHSNNGENDATVAVYGRTEDGRYDAMAFTTQRKSDDLRKPDGKPFRFSAIDAPSSLAKLNIRLTPEQLLTLTAMQSGSAGWGPFAAMGEDVPRRPRRRSGSMDWTRRGSARPYIATRTTIRMP